MPSGMFIPFVVQYFIVLHNSPIYLFIVLYLKTCIRILMSSCITVRTRRAMLGKRDKDTYTMYVHV